MKISVYNSEKLKFFNFWLIVGVVILHSTTDVSQDNIYSKIQVFISFYLMQVCVPFFFMISGYLFYLGSDFKYFEKVKKRFNSLIIPYLIASISVFIIMYYVQQLPSIQVYFPSKLVNMSIKDKLLNALYYPYNYPLWFLRQLIIFVLFSPLFLYFIKYFKLFGVIFLLLILSFKTDNAVYNSIINTNLLYFILGAYISINKLPIDTKIKNLNIFVLGCMAILLNIVAISFQEKDVNHFFDYVLSFKNMFGIFFLWFLYDKLPYRFKNIYKINYNKSFFIYLYHGIPIVLLTSVIAKFIDNSLLLFLSYILCPFIIIVCLVLISKFFNKYASKMYQIINGGRI